MKRFYSHLVAYETILLELEKLELSEKEKYHLTSLVDSTLHNTILDAILNELSEADKKDFLYHLHSSDHNRIWEFLNKKVDRVEENIKQTAHDLMVELHKDILNAKKIKEKHQKK